MKIILIENVDRVGTAGSIINVKDGYARNYLIPKKLAILATAGNIKRIDSIRAAADESTMLKLHNIKKNSYNYSIFNRKADENGRLFFSI